ncbi:MAG: hypothetical protein AUK63_186 [bacterium P3]|nr:MAG: hypothetical protein AUK63_186 [bacterium P3]KWW42352.1 MAG: hypothetical protein F083_256 [bacterium F083]
MHTLLYALYLVVVPVIVMRAGRRWRWIERISPMTVLYIIGLIIANLTHFSSAEQVGGVTDLFNAIAVPMAIPLMLMSCNLKGWSVGKAAKVFFCGLFSVVACCVVGYFLFRDPDNPGRFAQVSAVTTGLYTGGIPNVGAISQAVGISNELYLYITSYDLIVTGAYLVFIIFAGKAVFRRLLPSHDTGYAGDTPMSDTQQRKQTVGTIFHELWLPFLLTALIVAAAVGVSTICAHGGERNMTILILTLTTLSIAATLLPAIRRRNTKADSEGRQPLSFECGLYCVYLFCFAIANSCDIRQMDLAGSLEILSFLAFVIFGSLALQVLLAKLLKIDGDSVLVSSISLINSPPFVPMVAALLGNKDIIVLGITVGLLGYMLGNYMGIGVFLLLSAIG